MARQYSSIDISDEPLLQRLAEEVRATGEPRLLRRGDEDIAALVPLSDVARPRKGGRKGAMPVLADPSNIWAGYDPQKVLDGLRRSAGALAGVDRDELLRDIYAQRGQDSSGRPSD